MGKGVKKTYYEGDKRPRYGATLCEHITGEFIERDNKRIFALCNNAAVGRHPATLKAFCAEHRPKIGL